MQFWNLYVNNLDTFDFHAVYDFNYIEETGNLVFFQNNISTLIYFDFFETRGKRQIKTGIVPQKSGIYSLSVNIFQNENGDFFNVPFNNCFTEVDYTFTTNRTTQDQNNHHLFLESPLPENQEYPKESFDKVGSIAFIVKE